MLHNFDRSPLVETVPSLAEPRVHRLSKTRLAGLLREFSIHSLGTGIASRLPHLPSFSMGAGASDLGPHSSIARTLTHQATCAAPYPLSYRDESHGHFRHPANKLLTPKRLLFLPPLPCSLSLRTAKGTGHLTQVCPPPLITSLRFRFTLGRVLFLHWPLFQSRFCDASVLPLMRAIPPVSLSCLPPSSHFPCTS